MENIQCSPFFSGVLASLMGMVKSRGRLGGIPSSNFLSKTSLYSFNIPWSSRDIFSRKLLGIVTEILLSKTA